EQGLWHDPDHEPRYSERLELDLGTVVPSIAGPKRPQDRISLSDAKTSFRDALQRYVADDYAIETGPVDEAPREAFPASDPPAGFSGQGADDRPYAFEHSTAKGRPSGATPVRLADGTEFEVDHGAVVIAAIPSCTNTSNPSVMIGAALLAKNAVEK